MKKNKTCPKCDGQRILVSERVGFQQKLYKGEESYVAPLPVVARVKSVPGMLFGTSKTVEEVGTYQSYTCLGCGFTELYAANVEALAGETTQT